MKISGSAHGFDFKLTVTRSADFAVVKVYEPVREKTNNLGSDQVQHKLGCTVTDDG